MMLILAAAVLGQVKVPRPAAELTMNTPAGARVTLEGYRGHVVVVAFMVTQCPHCQSVSRQLESLYQELGGRGLRVMGAIFNDDGDAGDFANRFKLHYPVGRVAESAVEDFMGVPRGHRVGTPQLAFIDKRGRIRAQTEREGTPLLQQPDVMRSLIDALLKERP